jgi:hypothetical protein
MIDIRNSTSASNRLDSGILEGLAGNSRRYPTQRRSREKQLSVLWE